MDNSLESTPARERHNYRPAVFVVALVLIAGITVFLFALNNKSTDGNAPSSNNTSEVEQPKENPKTSPEETPAEPEKTPEEAGKESEEIVNDKTPVKQDGEDPNTLSELTGVINYAAVEDDVLMIRISIDQYLEYGTCLLELTAEDDSFSLSDNIAQSASTSTCSYDIATSLLTGGRYDINITINSSGKKGTIKGEVDV